MASATIAKRASIEQAVRAHFEDKVFGTLDAMLAEDLILKPPTYWKPWRGRAPVTRLLCFAASNIDRLVYRRIFWKGDHAAFQFDAEIGGIAFSGVDFFSFDADGRVVQVEIMARPPKAIALIGERMGASVAADPFFSKA